MVTSSPILISVVEFREFGIYALSLWHLVWKEDSKIITRKSTYSFQLIARLCMYFILKLEQ